MIRHPRKKKLQDCIAPFHLSTSYADCEACAKPKGEESSNHSTRGSTRNEGETATLLWKRGRE